VLNIIKFFYGFFLSFGVDFRKALASVLGIPKFAGDFLSFFRQNKEGYKVTYQPVLGEHKLSAGLISKHYFKQDIIVAREIFKKDPGSHYDVGSRLDGFVAHLLCFRDVHVIDIRSLENVFPGLFFEQGAAENLENISTGSVESLSCLHAFEHIGLGRYGDRLDLKAINEAAKEFVRILRPGGYLYLSVPVSGCSTIVFNAHRIFDPTTIIDLFSSLKLYRSICIDDEENIHFSDACEVMRSQKYGCGIFVFKKIEEQIVEAVEY